jgi:hypothetical protein
VLVEQLADQLCELLTEVVLGHARDDTRARQAVRLQPGRAR